MYVEKTPTCWVWTGNKPDGRYGHTKYLGKTYLVHRVAYELFVGPIPDGQWVLHRCDNPPCVRPDHLFLGTPSDNTRDKVAKNRGGVGQIHGRTHLSDDDVRLIYAEMVAATQENGRVRRGVRAALAARFGVDRGTISRLHRGHSFKYLDRHR